MRRSKILTSCLCVLALGIQAGDAAAKPHRTYYSEFDIGVQGQMVEKWAKSVDHEYGCSPRTESSGGATIRFATRKPYRVTADPYTGFHGRPLLDVSVDRYGQSREANLDGSDNADCAAATPNRDGSACGQRSFSARLLLANTSRFGLSFPGDRHQYDYDCPYPDATPALGEAFYESTSIIGLNGSNVDWKDRLFGGCDGRGHCHNGKRVLTIHNVRHVVSPYAKPAYGGEIQGDYQADIDWTATITRAGRLHSGR